MQIPFIKYVEALVACRYPIDVIYDRVNALGVTLSGIFPREAIGQVYAVLSKSAPEYYKNSSILPDPDWLRELGVLKMVSHELKLETPEGTVGIEGAFEILKDINMYQIMSALGLAKVNEQDIELIVNGKYNIHYTSEDILEFLHYFFNVEDWSLSQKKDYVSMVDVPKLKSLYEIAMDGDKDYLIWKLGIAPDKSFDQMLRDMGADAYYNFKEKMKHFPDEAQKWGQLMIRLTEKLDKLTKDSEDKRSLFDQIQFVIQGKTAEDEMETVIDATGTMVKSKKLRNRHITEIKE